MNRLEHIMVNVSVTSSDQNLAWNLLFVLLPFLLGLQVGFHVITRVVIDGLFVAHLVTFFVLGAFHLFILLVVVDLLIIFAAFALRDVKHLEDY